MHVVYSHRRFRKVLFIWALLLIHGGGYSHAAVVSQEYQLKAAILFNFARFISWPERALQADGAPLNFCVVGPNPFESILNTLEQKKIGGHQIKIHYLPALSPETQCHLAFFAGTTAEKVDTYSEKLRADSTIAVSDYPGFVKAGGDIEFTRVQDRVQFIINNTSLKKKGMDPRASLLQLAAEVR